MGAWIFLFIFFGIIIALIIVAVVGSKKDRMEKLIENDKRKKLMSSISNDRIALFSFLNKTIEDLDKEVKNFQPSVGTKSLGDINKEAQNKIKKLASSNQLIDIYKSDDYKNEIKPIIDLLVKVKPSNWFKEASFAIGLIKAKFEALNKNAIKEYNKIQ